MTHKAKGRQPTTISFDRTEGLGGELPGGSDRILFAKGVGVPALFAEL
jgi:hypothetical protein